MPDHQQLLIRRAVAGGIGVVVLLLLFVGVKGCLDSRKENALKDYNRDVTGIAQDSTETAKAFYETLVQSDLAPVEQQTQINQLRVQAEKQLQDAEDLSVPGDMEPAQQNLLLALQFREEAIARVAQRIPTARGSDRAQAEEATSQIAGQMEKLLASDIVWSQRVSPFIKQTLDAEGIQDRITDSRVVSSLSWLDTDTVAGRIGGQAAAGDTSDGAEDTGDVAPGLHGHGILSTAVGDVALQPGGTPNRIAATSNPTFTVKFANQGENNEQDVRVRVSVKPQSGKAIEATKTVDQTTAGAEAEVQIPLGEAPPIGQPSTITVEVVKVPGEKKTDNNRQEYTALFTR
ncbi:MAG: hypothetical protein JHC95_12060 [Solirubrobacteraceae bacterium]|nr:hypothetical protein [Solirubrobacteraceae bacterium]